MTSLDAAAVDAPVLNIRRVIDDGAVTAFQVRAIALCSLVAFLDGLDSQSIAVAGPLIADGIGSLVGMAGAGRLVEAFGARAVLVPGFLLGAVAVGAMGHAAASVPAMAAALFLVGLLVGAGASGSLALAALTYPTPMRSTGIGWAMGMGRFGQVLAPLLAGAAVAAGWDGAHLFLAFAIAPVLGALAILALHGRPPIAARAR